MNYFCALRTERVMRARERARQDEEARRLAELAEIRKSNFQERKDIKAQIELGVPRPVATVVPSPSFPAAAAVAVSPPRDREPTPPPVSRPTTAGDIEIGVGEMSEAQREENARQGVADYVDMLGDMQDVLAGVDARDNDSDEAGDGESGGGGVAPSGGPEEEDDTAGGQPMGKFKLLGATLRLPNVSERDSVAHRIESLRMFLEKMVGDDLFLQVYRLLDGMTQTDDEDIIMAKASAMLGPKKIYLSLVNQLIYCEDVFYDRIR